jgi:hypothetical protein
VFSATAGTASTHPHRSASSALSAEFAMVLLQETEWVPGIVADQSEEAGQGREAWSVRKTLPIRIADSAFGELQAEDPWHLRSSCAPLLGTASEVASGRSATQAFLAHRKPESVAADRLNSGPTLW